MRTASCITAFLIVALGAWAVLTTPSSVTALGAGPAWRLPAASPLTADGQPARPPRIVRRRVLVIERPSPITAHDGTLVESLGVEVDNGKFMTVLRKGARAPQMEFLPVVSATAEQTGLRVHVLRGDSEMVAQNHSLGWVRITGLGPFEAGKPRAALMFSVRDGAIELAALDPQTGDPMPFELSGP